MTMDVQTVFIGGLTLCKRDVATEVMVEVDDSDFETKIAYCRGNAGAGVQRAKV